MAPQVVIDASKSLLQCTGMDDLNTLTSSALDPLQRWVMPWSTLYPINKVLVPTRLDLGATTLLMMLKALLMLMKTLEMALKPSWMMEKPLMGS